MTGEPAPPLDIEALLAKTGWPAERMYEDTWRTSFHTRSGTLPLFVRQDPAGYVSFAILPFLKSPKERDAADRLYKKLLELNQSLFMAKFSIDDDLDVVLSVEYPIADLDETEFNDALDVLSFYADKHQGELNRLGQPEQITTE